MTDLEATFRQIYDAGVWGTGSGPGSDIANTRPYLEFLRGLIREKGIRSIVDCGCGDWQTIRHLDLTGIDYLGLDIVPSVVARNQHEHGRANVRFEVGDFATTELPPGDLVICKDALQHLPDGAVFSFLSQIHKYKHALITNDWTASNDVRDFALLNNHYHYAPLDMTAPPFGLRAREVLRFMGSKVSLLVEDTTQDIQFHTPRRADWLRPGAHEGDAPTVLLAILAKQKAGVLPTYLRCLEALDYPKQSISVYIRTNNNTDDTRDILHEWMQRVGGQYARIEFDDHDVEARVQDFGEHEWNPSRFKVLAEIRQRSLDLTEAWGCDYYFVPDVDNFVRPHTLGALVGLGLPIVAPLLRQVDFPWSSYSNYHHEVDANGYFVDSVPYHWLVNRDIRGICQVDCVHCTYLVRRDVIPFLRYADGTERHEYVIFSDSARRHAIGQYLDTRDVYGYLTLEGRADLAEKALGFEVDVAIGRGGVQRSPAPNPSYP